MKEEITSFGTFKQINGLGEFVEVNFGSLQRKDITVSKFKPEKSSKDENVRNFDNITHFQIYEAIVTNPSFSNVKQVLAGILNEQNAGFGLIVIHNKIINSKAISKGPTMPYAIWKSLSDRITATEPDSWFQLQPDGEYADFILNRTPSHQEQLPCNKVDMDFIKEALQ